MESYSYTTSNSASSSSSSFQYQQELEKNVKPPPAYRSAAALHSVRKFPANKNIIMKKPIAPMPPTPPKIYKVNPVDFKDVVQRLTGGPDMFQPTRLQEVAPPPLSFSPPHRLSPIVHPTVKMPLSGKQSAGFGGEAQEEKPMKLLDSSFGPISPIGFSLSPSSLAWCSSMLLSP
ncbi:hypothetical protein DH2020_041019 [Rehmannia glutinosa]|uniref:VQ domain-containing protein n=1 Tax=Rehmannia glutinosa TaxID=99300 RepID=A0ABR0UT25_REHGL